MEKEITITKEQYDKLNDYYNKICLYLSFDDGIFLSNLYPFGYIASKVKDLLENVDLEKTLQDDCFSFLEIFDKAKDLMKKIAPDYVDDFNNIMSNGILDVNYDRLNIPYKERKIGQSYYSNKNTNKPSIEIDESFNYDAIAVLIHEYFHKSNDSKNRTRYLLTEFISIYFEMYTYELLKQEGIETDRLDIKFRLNDLYECSDFINDKAFFLYTYDQLGNFDDNTYKFINYVRITKEEFDKDLLYELQDFEKKEDRYNKNENIKKRYPIIDYYLSQEYSQDYKYFMGALLAYYSLYHLNKEDVLRLNEALIKNQKITFKEALKVLGISINDEFIDECINCVERYVDENDLYKKEEDIKKM